MILKMTPEQRSSLTRDAIWATTDEAHVEALKEVNGQAAQLEKALSSGSGVLPALDSFLRKPI